MCAYQIVVNTIAFNNMIQKPPTIENNYIDATNIKMP
jgi:poly(3-hydroxyalkanoate) synthetase